MFMMIIMQSFRMCDGLMAMLAVHYEYDGY